MKPPSRVVQVIPLLAFCWLWVAIPLTAQHKVLLVGSGSKVAGPLFGLWGKEFNRHNPGVRVAYVPTNSSDGLEQVKTLHEDFAIGEIPLTDNQKNGASLHFAAIPIAVVSVVPVYNLPRPTALRFTGELLAQIYMGNIANWSDERIAKLNPGVSLPNLPIVLVQRPTKTGTRFMFTEFLVNTSPEFRKWMRNPSRLEPKSVLESSNQGVVTRVASTRGAVGFVMRSFATSVGLSCGSVQNSSGKFLTASPESVHAAATAMQEEVFSTPMMPLTNAPGEGSYPITSFVWVYLPLSGLGSERIRGLQDFLSWCLDEGQNFIAGNVYDPLPDRVATKAQSKLAVLWEKGEASETGKSGLPVAACTACSIPNRRHILLLSNHATDENRQPLGPNPRRTAQTAPSQDSAWYSTGPQRHAVPPRGYSLVATPCSPREHFPLLRRRPVCGGGLACERISPITARPGSGT